MIVLGIDPGTASTGYGVVAQTGAQLRMVAHGVVETRAGVPLERRLCDIHAEIGALIERHRPVAVAIEELYFGANVRTAFAVGQARGVVLLAAGQRGLHARSYTPQQVKAAVCGSGRAEKDQVGRMVARMLGLGAVPSPDHAADALAVAICDLNRAPLAAAIDGDGGFGRADGPKQPGLPPNARIKPAGRGAGVRPLGDPRPTLAERGRALSPGGAA